MKRLFTITFWVLLVADSTAQSIIADKSSSNTFSLNNVIIYVDENDYPLVKKSAALLQKDIEMVTGKKPQLVNKFPSSSSTAIIIGSLQKSPGISQLIKQQKISTNNIKGKWEAYQLRSLPNALIIAGSDRRGTAYGVFELSKQIGVSPWYWWADVPAKKKKEIFIKTNIVLVDSPKVKYRGIFINDEAPAFSGWTKEKFGGVNHQVYEKVFELILRLKGNYLWPAMWGNAFNDDDTLNPILADTYGIVMGTSHHEPMLRAQQEWKRYGKGKWDYDSNEVVLKDFWRKGVQNMGSHESILTIGMRGDGDMPMSRETATNLLERIVKDQRQIIEEVTGKPASETPQLWALYKEVQDYYDKGMRVPDDVTLLLCDDNWGNIRKLPKLSDPPRKGGYGIYYHFDYVGGPRNYKWINTNNIARVWEQMHLAYEYGVKQIWIVNVGDIKPMEFPISFFLDYAWNPDKWNEDNLREYYMKWAASQFDEVHAKEIGNILRLYSQYSSRRKPELLDANTYKPCEYPGYNEANVILKEWNNLQQDAEKINALLPQEYGDAFFEFVLHPVKALANLHHLYTAVAINRLYASQKNLSANDYANSAKEYYKQDSLITILYHTIANGKWNHMMDQTHIGYTYWQQPPKQKMPDVKYIQKDSAEEEIPKELVSFETAKDSVPKDFLGNAFYEEQGLTSIQAAHYTKAINTSNIQWKIIPDIGRYGDGITTFPVTAKEQKLNKNSPHLEYDFYTYSRDSFKLNTYFSPTLNFHNTETGLQYGISVDDEIPQTISINNEDKNTGTGVWNKWVSENIIIKTTSHKILTPGKHTVKYWMVNPGVVLQKLVLDFGGLEPSYLGPPETRVNK